MYLYNNKKKDKSFVLILCCIYRLNLVDKIILFVYIILLLTGFICQESNSENKLPRYVVLDVSCSSDADVFVMLMARCMIIMVLDFINTLSI